MRTFIVLGLALLTLVGCMRKAKEDQSVVSIVTPGSQSKSGVGSLAAPPSNRKSCYGISVTGPGIPGNPSTSCSPSTGLLAGFIEPGGVVQLSVPKGTDRKIDLYLFLQKEGENIPCPAMSPSLAPPASLNQVYLIATLTGVALTKEKEELQINASFPGLAQTVVQQLALPTNCAPVVGATPNRPGFNILPAGGIASGSSIKLIGQVGRVDNSAVLTGGGMKLKVK